MLNANHYTLVWWEEPSLSPGILKRTLSHIDYITPVESMCIKLKEEDAMELRANINALLRKAKPPKPNLTKEERTGLLQLKKDKDRVVLTADKEWPW